MSEKTIKDCKLKTLDWMEKLGKKKHKGIPIYQSGYNKYIFTIYGRLYATNGYILAAVDYPEFEHLSDFGWRVLDYYKDGKGQLLEPENVVLAFPEICNTMRERVFEDLFIKPVSLHWDASQRFNANMIAECMKPFNINGISPSLSMNGEILEFSGHNKHVSIKVLMVGEISK